MPLDGRSDFFPSLPVESARKHKNGVDTRRACSQLRVHALPSQVAALRLGVRRRLV